MSISLFFAKLKNLIKKRDKKEKRMDSVPGEENQIESVADVLK